eukprot:TRINITY_DN20282_c0_g1_i1.p1 TRINITY_DN20282_c0_g1~~TRINITY_DN20282_c0_g1_i1.p1  ORF type:complete len:296 (-),score=52.87 TRINITY_DN20282_c0_g1_i1:179-1000(-)
MELPSNPFSLAGKTAIVTGAGSGIGKAIATMFVARGAVVGVFDFDLPAAEKVVAELNAAASKRSDAGRAEACKCDVSDESAVNAAFDSFASKHGRLDILVNNAGISSVGNVEAATGAEMDRVYNVNVKGLMFTAKAGVKHMKALNGGRGGSIVNLASIASLVGLKDRFIYGMTKGAVLTMTYALATDYVQDKIRCNCVCPGRVHTPFVDGFLAKNYPGKEKEMYDKLAAWQPLGRMGRPDEIAALILYLASDESSFVTGAAYAIDGGRSGCAL